MIMYQEKDETEEVNIPNKEAEENCDFDDQLLDEGVGFIANNRGSD